MNEIVKLGLDIYHGSVPTEFSNKDHNKVMREALIEANGGKDSINYKVRGANKDALFAIVEEIIASTTEEGLKGDEFFMSFVDYKNLSEGDANEFTAEENTTFIVSELARGVLTPRRQRIGEKRTVNLRTTPKAVRIYEEMSRILAGRVNWTDFVNKLNKAVITKKYEELYTIFSSISSTTPGMNGTYAPAAGTYDEDKLLQLVQHVEASTGPASIVGTKSALAKIKTAEVSNSAKENYHELGFYGKVAGVPMIMVPQRHKVGTDQFIFPDKKVYIIAGDDKPVKYVTEGSGVILDKDPLSNDDMTQEYYYIEQTGSGLLMNGKMGIYEMS